MAKPQLTELATGERVISERITGVRSIALSSWIGGGSRDELDARAGVSHVIEACSSRAASVLRRLVAA